MAQSLKEFRDATLAQLAEIRDNQDTMKQIIDGNIVQYSTINNKFECLQQNIDQHVRTIASSLSSLTNSSSTTCEAPASSVPPEPPLAPTSSLESPEPRQPPLGGRHKAHHQEHTPAGGADPSTTSEKPSVITAAGINSRHLSSKMPNRMPTSTRPKILFIADSIGRNVDVRHLEEASNSLIYSVKAYGANYEADAFHPNLNFIEASLKAPSNNNYSYAILQGSSTDITNLDTSFVNSAHLEFLKQKVLVASQNMISAARNIVVNNPNIEKVLILDRIPRFDPSSTDVSQLKPKLSEYGNKVLRDELSKCDVKDRISIGAHMLPAELHQNIYGHPARRGYDGIQPHGPDGRNFYTRSMCNILQQFLPKHSREFHNHAFPHNTRAPSSTSVPYTEPSSSRPFSQPSSQPSSSQPPASSSQTSAPSSAKSKSNRFQSTPDKTPNPLFNTPNPDDVIIEMESFETCDHHYSIPSSNYYNLLGN